MCVSHKMGGRTGLEEVSTLRVFLFLVYIARVILKKQQQQQKPQLCSGPLFSTSLVH